jgi:hypothetical protein
MVYYITAVTVVVMVPNWVFAEDDPKPKPPQPPMEREATDMTGGKQGNLGEYDVVPVPRGALVDEKGIALHQVVKNTKGETLGTIEKLMKDTKTGRVEYAVLEVEGTKHQLPLQWSQFKQSGGQLTLNATKAELQPSTNAAQSKDTSPDTSTYMEEINKARRQPKPEGRAPDAGSTDRPAAAGPMGELEVGGAGPSGTRALPPGGGDHPSSKP